MNLFTHFKGVVTSILNELAAAGDLPQGLDFSNAGVEPPRDPSHGDITTNAAMVLAKPAKANPREIAAKIAAKLSENPDIDSVEIAGPGFINMRLSQKFWLKLLSTALEQSTEFGKSNIGQNQAVNVEYVSVNPTGPLHVGHCRGAVFGDALASLLEATGYDVTREYYINDAGGQINVLANSAYLRYLEAIGEDIGEIPEGLYPGDYLVPVGVALKDEFGDSLKSMDEDERLAILKEKSIAMMMDLIRSDLETLNIKHEVFFSEKKLHEDGGIEQAIEALKQKGLIYEGTLPPPKGKLPDDWENREQTLFKSTDFGDDVDRALVKSNGDYTYFAADVAYTKNKIDRGFKQLVYVLGADHGGYVKRLQAVCKAFSNDDVKLIARLVQLVNLSKGGEPFKMSKRAGTFVTLRDVVEEVGPDVVRFMMLYRKNEASLDFDLQKVTEQSRDNPVFYVQYAHARICSVFRNADKELGAALESKPLDENILSCLKDDAELATIKSIAEYPRVLEAAALAHEPHRIAFYLYDLAGNFHSLWNKGKDNSNLRFIVQDSLDVTIARLALLRAIRQILANGLEILGVTPVQEM